MDLDTLDTAIERIRWAAGIVELICTDPDTQPQVREAADCAASQLRDARRLLVRLAERGRERLDHDTAQS